MSALQFLNKKSWHTATIKNNEKVWLKEQAAEKEKKRIEELQKQLAEERKLQEIQRLEEQSGRLDPAELLKRRRLNWMYEHGPDKDEKKEIEKDREDMLLGRKEVDLEKLQEPVNHTTIAEEEAKMREDPLVQIELQRARALRLAGRDPSGRDDKEREEKRKRKEERARIREERRLRREKRALKRSRGTQQREGDEERRESGRHGRERGNQSSLARTSHKRKMEKLLEIERQLLDEDHQSPPKQDEEQILARKRRRMDNSQERSHSPSQEGRRDEHGNHDRNRRYGLSLPEKGSGVAVTREFVPWARQRTGEEISDEERRRYRYGARRSLSPKRGRRQESKRVLSTEERENKLAEMRREADKIDEERRGRAKRYAKEEVEEKRSLHKRGDPTRSFARDCITAGASGASTSGRIRQRRAWATRDSDAAY